MLLKTEKSTYQIITLNGVISAYNKDKSGNVLHVVLETSDFENYLVENDDIGKKLLNLVGNKIKVMCAVIGNDSNNIPIIKIVTIKKNDVD